MDRNQTGKGGGEQEHPENEGGAVRGGKNTSFYEKFRASPRMFPDADCTICTARCQKVAPACKITSSMADNGEFDLLEAKRRLNSTCGVSVTLQDFKKHLRDHANVDLRSMRQSAENQQ